MRSLSCYTIVFVSALVNGCGSGENQVDPDAGGTKGSGGSGGTVIPMSCTNPFAKLEAPFSANNAGYALVVADASGLVVSGIPDARQLSDPMAVRDYPNVIFTIDMQGAIQTIWTDDTTKMPVAMAADATNVYFQTLGLGGDDIMSVPRAGGTATVLVDGSVWAGLALVGGKLYYAGDTATYDQAVFELDLATGVSTVLSNRGDMTVSAFAADATTVYWTESDGTLGSNAYGLYKLSLVDNSVVALGSLSRDAGISELLIGGDQLFVGGIVGTSISFQLSRVVPGAAPVVVANNITGAIALTQDTAYYGNRSGLIKTPLDFSVTTPLPGTAGMEISAVAVGPQHVWYAEFSCIYRMER